MQSSFLLQPFRDVAVAFEALELGVLFPDVVAFRTICGSIQAGMRSRQGPGGDLRMSPSASPQNQQQRRAITLEQSFHPDMPKEYPVGACSSFAAPSDRSQIADRVQPDASSS